MFSFLHFFLENQSKHYYGVRIVTGTYFNSGTNDTGIYVTLVGEKATKKLFLLSFFSSNRSTYRNSYFDLLIETENLGEVAVVLLGNNKNKLKIAVKNDWFVEYVCVYDLTKSSSREFPCYHWIEDGKFVTMTSTTSE